MPQTTLVASSCAITLPPAATIAAAPSVPSVPMPVRISARFQAPQTSAADANSGSTAGLQKCTGGAVIEHDHRGAVAARDLHVLAARREIDRARPAPARRPPPRAPCLALARLRCSARMVVNVGGMCCVISTGAAFGDGVELRDQLGQRLRSAGRRADQQHARRDQGKRAQLEGRLVGAGAGDAPLADPLDRAGELARRRRDRAPRVGRRPRRACAARGPSARIFAIRSRWKPPRSSRRLRPRASEYSRRRRATAP